MKYNIYKIKVIFDYEDLKVFNKMFYPFELSNPSIIEIIIQIMIYHVILKSNSLLHQFYHLLEDKPLTFHLELFFFNRVEHLFI